MTDKIIYFGYGANSSEEMMEAIIGRKPEGFPVILEGYELYIQSWEEMLEDVRNFLLKDWSEDFRTYCIRPGNGIVRGKIWIITGKEKELIGKWEKHGTWYEPVEVEVKHRTDIVKAHTEIINNPSLKKVDGYFYPAFLNNKEKMLEIARKDYGKNKKLKG